MSLLADENVDPKIIAQIRLHIPDVDFLHVRDVGLNQTPDTTILEWAAANDRVVVTHDKSTMRDFAEDGVRAGLPMPGLFVLHDNLPTGARREGSRINPTGQRIRH